MWAISVLESYLRSELKGLWPAGFKRPTVVMIVAKTQRSQETGVKAVPIQSMLNSKSRIPKGGWSRAVIQVIQGCWSATFWKESLEWPSARDQYFVCNAFKVLPSHFFVTIPLVDAELKL